MPFYMMFNLVIFFNKYISDILSNVNDNTILLGGRISDYLKGKFSAYSLNWRDYLLREELAVQNAIPVVLAI